MTDTAPLPPEAHSIVLRLNPLWSVTVHRGRHGWGNSEIVRVSFENLTDACSAAGVWVDGLFQGAAAWPHCADPVCRVGVVHPAGGMPHQVTLDELETVVTDEPRIGWGAA